jgi:hypothetical protein
LPPLYRVPRETDSAAGVPSKRGFRQVLPPLKLFHSFIRCFVTHNLD